MNGGKDIKIGHDKRPVSVVPSDEQLLYNIGNGQILTDEFGNPLVTKVDQFFLLDATAERSTSIVFPSEPTHKYPRTLITQTGATTATYGLDLDVPIVVVSTTKKIPVLKATGSTPTKLVTNTVRLRDLDENGNPIAADIGLRVEKILSSDQVVLTGFKVDAFSHGSEPAVGDYISIRRIFTIAKGRVGVN